MANGINQTQDQKPRKKRILNPSGVDFDKDPYKVDLPENKRKELERYFKKVIDKMIDDRREFDEKLKRWNSIYSQEKNAKTFPWENASNIHVPYPATVTDTTVSRCNRSLFTVRPYVILKPREASDTEVVDKQQVFIEYLIDDVTKFRDTMDRGLYYVAIDGTVIYKNGWVREEEIVMDMEHYDFLDDFLSEFPDGKTKYPEFYNRLQVGKSVDIYVEYTDEVYNAPKPQIVDLSNFYASDDRIFEN